MYKNKKKIIFKLYIAGAAGHGQGSEYKNNKNNTKIIFNYIMQGLRDMGKGASSFVLVVDARFLYLVREHILIL
jgi:hypothetical protein